MSQTRKRKRTDNGTPAPRKVSKTAKKAKKGEELSPEAKEKLIGDLMRFFLFKDCQKHPVRRAEINAKVLGDHKGQNLAGYLLAEAKERFAHLFGFDLVEVPKITAKQKQGPPQSSGVYILINKLSPEERKLLELHARPEFALLMVVLSLIQLNSGTIDSDVLYRYLSQLGLDDRDDKSDHFTHSGNSWRKALATFERELYLRKKKSNKANASGEPIYEYTMGQRSLVEITPAQILGFIAQIFGDEVDPIHEKQLLAESQTYESENDSSSSESESESESDSG